ncbi:hypothetical protein BJ170DRAFT_681568 [Xylariales sp. AK1849]|nr:hypothetical protein BJ170DRAFT_681568 [Xylariales sp. AK1849]
MSGSQRRAGRPASMQASFRPGEGREGAPARRGGATSPSANSSSTEDEGGASLGANMPKLATLSLEGLSGGVTYAPPHVRQGLGSSGLGQSARGTPAMRSSPGFQVGNVPDDGDVFGGSPDRLTRASVLPLNPTMSMHDRRNRETSTAPEQIEEPLYVHDMGPPPVPFREPAMLVSPEHGFSDPVPRTGGYDSPTHPLRTRGSDLSARHQVGGVDAQLYYPPSACVFVANLPEGVNDSRLETEVTKQFSKFGIVFVKIRRDSKNMPFAFCQYTRNEDAQSAMIEGKGIVIHGRACRTEMVRANRTYIMHTNNGRDLDVDEARHALSAFGPLVRCEQLDPANQERLGTGLAVIVEFKKFDPAKDVQAAFRHHPTYRVISYDPKKSFRNSNKADADEAWLQRYEVDRRSVFIGGLPVDDDNLDAKIRELMEEIGDVLTVQVIRKDDRTGYGATVFSFIEFARPDMAEIAVDRLAGRQLFGNRVRIERKACREASGRNTRRIRSQYSIGDSYESPARDQGHISKSYNHRIPQTPLRPADANTGPSAIVSPETLSVPSSAQHYSSYTPYSGHSYTSPNYITSPSPYGAQLGAGAGAYPASQQMTPQGMPTPYGYYPAADFSWMSPYMSDPRYAHLAMSHAWGQMPVPSVNDTPDTPTRATGAGEDEGTESQGDDA